MTIQFQCECGKTLKARDEWAGKKGRCSRCGKSLMIPRLEEPETPDPTTDVIVAATSVLGADLPESWKCEDAQHAQDAADAKGVLRRGEGNVIQLSGTGEAEPLSSAGLTVTCHSCNASQVVSGQIGSGGGTLRCLVCASCGAKIEVSFYNHSEPDGRTEVFLYVAPISAPAGTPHHLPGISLDWIMAGAPRAAGSLMEVDNGGTWSFPVAEPGQGVFGIQVAPDGFQGVTWGADGVVRIWDLTVGRQVKTFDRHEHRVLCANYSPCGRFIASGGMDKDMWYWDTQETQKARGFSHGDSVDEVAFSPSGRIVAAASGTHVTLWDVKRSEQVGSLGHETSIGGVAFSPDGRFIASAAGTTRPGLPPYMWYDCEVRVWDALSLTETRRLEGNKETNKNIAFMPDGRSIFAAGREGIIRRWDVESGEQLSSFHGQQRENWSIAISPDGRLLASGDDRTVRLWDIEAEKELRSFPATSGARVTFFPDSEKLIWVDDITVTIAGCRKDEP